MYIDSAERLISLVYWF